MFVVVFIIIIASIEAFLAIRFIYKLLNDSSLNKESKYQPKVAVILCLRGVDVCLNKCLESLVKQDYPDYSISIIVDNLDDEAWKYLDNLTLNGNNVEINIDVLNSPENNCSLKCSSQIQAINKFTKNHEIIAFIDTDNIPNKNWLKTLVSPMSAPDVAVTTGIRWYMPPDLKIATFARVLWNAAANIQMHFYKIPWGGSLAIKRDVIIKLNLIDIWKHTFCEDTCLNKVLNDNNLKIKQVTNLILFNRESCSITSFYQFIRRQLITVRLHHEKWPFVAMHGIMLLIILLSIFIIISFKLILDISAIPVYPLYIFLLYELLLMVLFIISESIIQNISCTYDNYRQWLNPFSVIKLFISLPVAQIIYVMAVINSIFAQTIKWRGINYKILPGGNIQMLEYKIYKKNVL